MAVALGPDGKIYAIGGYGGGGPGSSSQAAPQNNMQGGSQTASPNETDTENKTPQQSNCLFTAERFDFEKGEWEMLPDMN